MEVIKVVLVTGCDVNSSAAATTKLLATKGYKVAIQSNNKDHGDALVNECIELGCEKQKVFATSIEPSQCVRDTIEYFERIDALVVGSESQEKHCELGDFKTYRNIMKGSCMVPVSITFNALPYLQQTKGCIVFIAALDATKAYDKLFAFGIAKSALVMFSRCLAIEFGGKIRINSVSPGALEKSSKNDDINEYLRKCTLLRRLGKAQEVASLVAFLVSNEACFIHGQNIIIDGGMNYTAPPIAF